MFYIPPPPPLLLSSSIPRSAGSKQRQSTYFKKLQLPSDRSAKRFSFNINQQTCRAETCRRVSLPQKCLHPGINLKFAAKAVFVVINNQIFEPFFSPLISCTSYNIIQTEHENVSTAGCNSTVCCYTNFQRQSKR